MMPPDLIRRLRPLLPLSLALLLGASQPASCTRSDASQLAADKGCYSCHAVDEDRSGPSFRSIARRNRARSDAPALLLERVRHGSLLPWKTGPWYGDMPPPEARGEPVSEAEAQQLVDWILSLE